MRMSIWTTEMSGFKKKNTLTCTMVLCSNDDLIR